ncbi:MAG: hypothetical protein QG652_1436 [Pseudomonadota bacterium]|nr:hypothetical protein [Pseudomonadota bacterium]
MTCHKATKIIEQICNLGCNRVNEIIEQLERGERTDETNGLNREEIVSVLQELKAIMAVYRKRT